MKRIHFIIFASCAMLTSAHAQYAKSWAERRTEHLLENPKTGLSMEERQRIADEEIAKIDAERRIEQGGVVRKSLASRPKRTAIDAQELIKQKDSVISLSLFSYAKQACDNIVLHVTTERKIAAIEEWFESKLTLEGMNDPVAEIARQWQYSGRQEARRILVNKGYDDGCADLISQHFELMKKFGS